jgi:hypothetical protein
MARRKRHTKKHHRRRRHIGAAGKMLNPAGPLVQYGSIAAGYFVGGKINDAIETATGGKVDGKIIAAAEVIVGGMLTFGKGKKTMVKSLAGGVLLGAGIKKGLTEFGVISGFQSVPVLAGYQSVPVLGGYNVPSPGGSLAGYSVPTPMHKSVMGGVAAENGSGINDTDR